MDSIPTSRFYKVLGILSLSLIVMGVCLSYLTYVLGVSQGETDCERAMADQIIHKQQNVFDIQPYKVDGCWG